MTGPILLTTLGIQYVTCNKVEVGGGRNGMEYVSLWTRVRIVTLSHCQYTGKDGQEEIIP